MDYGLVSGRSSNGVQGLARYLEGFQPVGVCLATALHGMQASHRQCKTFVECNKTLFPNDIRLI